jgi:hypothetical protein
MWAELYGLDDDWIEAMNIINKLDSMNLADVLVARYILLLIFFFKATYAKYII